MWGSTRTGAWCEAWAERVHAVRDSVRHCMSGEQLSALATILGGIIAAAGTAVAVYLTLASQRRDDARKIEASLRQEVAEFGRLAYAQFEVFKEAQSGKSQIPVRDLPALMAMPEPIVYKATADRIARLPYGALFVVFHARIAEVVSMATVYATAHPSRPETRPTPERFVDATTAETLAAGWGDICEIARTLLRRESTASSLTEATIASTLADLDSVHEQVAAKGASNPGLSKPT